MSYVVGEYPLAVDVMLYPDWFKCQPITQRFSIAIPFSKFLNMAAFSIIFRPRTKKMAGGNQNTSKSVSFRPEILARSE